MSSPFHLFGLPAGPSTGNRGRASHLDRLQRIREGTLPKPKTPDFAGLELSIPELDYYCLLERFPDLKAPDNATKLAAWKKFIRSPLSEPYRIHRRRKGST